MENLSKENKGKYIAGLFLIAIGALLVLSNFNLMDNEVAYYIFRWETYLILVGIVLLVSKSNKHTGFLILGIGLIFWSLDFFNYNLTDFLYSYWPILVILLGLYLLYRKSETKKETVEEIAIDPETAERNNSPTLSKTFFFSDGAINLVSPKFSFFNSSLLFSTLKLFFSNEQTNKSILINNSVILSSLVIRIPGNWRVTNNTVNILGEVIDTRKKQTFNEGTQVTVLLRGTNLLGSIKIVEL